MPQIAGHVLNTLSFGFVTDFQLGLKSKNKVRELEVFKN